MSVYKQAENGAVNLQSGIELTLAAWAVVCFWFLLVKD